MRRPLAALALAAAGALAAAAPAAAQAPPPTQTPGVLTVALDMPSDGFQVGSARGTEVVFARGLEVDLARALARRLGLAVRFVQEPDFRALLAPGAKAWDVALAQVSITAGRRRAVDLSAPYLAADQGVLVRRGLTPVPRTVAALRGLRLCVQRGTTGQAVVARRVRPAAPARAYADEASLIQGLETGRCDAVVFDAPTLAVLRAEVPRRVGPMAGVIATGERYGAVLPDQSPLTPAVSRAVQGLVRDGTVDALTRRWLAVDLAGLRVLPG